MNFEPPKEPKCSDRGDSWGKHVVADATIRRIERLLIKIT